MRVLDARVVRDARGVLHPQRELETPPSIPECMELRDVYGWSRVAPLFYAATANGRGHGVRHHQQARTEYTRRALALSGDSWNQDSVIAVTGQAFRTKAMHPRLLSRTVRGREMLRTAGESTDWAIGESLCFVLEECEASTVGKWVVESGLCASVTLSHKRRAAHVRAVFHLRDRTALHLYGDRGLERGSPRRRRSRWRPPCTAHEPTDSGRRQG